jgi:hypothetical protein
MLTDSSSQFLFPRTDPVFNRQEPYHPEMANLAKLHNMEDDVWQFWEVLVPLFAEKDNP